MINARCPILTTSLSAIIALATGTGCKYLPYNEPLSRTSGEGRGSAGRPTGEATGAGESQTVPPDTNAPSGVSAIVQD